MRKSLLAVLPMLPWPIRAHGLSVRYYPVLDYLADRYEIDLQIVGDYSQGGPIPDDPLFRKLRYFNVRDISSPAPSLKHRLPMMAKFVSPWGAPYEYAYYETPQAAAVVAERIGQVDYDAVLWVTYAYADAISQLRRRFPKPQYFVDLVDSPYLHYSRKRLSLFKRFDLWKTKRWESALCREHDAIYISPIDARAAGDHPATVIPNGIATGDYIERPPSSEPCIGFLGNMAYKPNIEAAQTLYEHVIPKLGRDAKLRIIGRDPAPVIQRMAGLNVIVTGAVHDIWEQIQKVTVMAFPMTSGGGLQNKVLESMFAGIPVVTTDLCNASIGARHGEQILSARSVDEMPDMIRMLLDRPNLRAQISQAGRQFVVDRYQTSAVVRKFEETLFGGRN